MCASCTWTPPVELRGGLPGGRSDRRRLRQRPLRLAGVVRWRASHAPDDPVGHAKRAASGPSARQVDSNDNTRERSHCGAYTPGVMVCVGWGGGGGLTGWRQTCAWAGTRRCTSTGTGRRGRGWWASSARLQHLPRNNHAGLEARMVARWGWTWHVVEGRVSAAAVRTGIMLGRS